MNPAFIMTNPSKPHPYEIVSDGASRAFIAVITDSSTVYLPWHALKRMNHDESRAMLSMEFAHESVELSGSGLATVAELAAVSRLKLIRQGASDEVCITNLRLVTDND